MKKLTPQELNQEINSLALYFSNREIGPAQIVSLCAAAAGEVLGRNRQAGILDDETAEAMLQTCFEQTRYVTFGGKSGTLEA